MLDSFYHLTLKILQNCILVCKRQDFPLIYALLYWTSLCFPKSCKPLVRYYSQTGHHVIKA